MPAKVKNLYKAKSLADLKKLAITSTRLSNNSNPKLLLKTADKIFVEALQYQSNGDEEMAYIMLMRYMDVITVIRKTSEFQRDQDFFRKRLGPSKPNEAMGNLEKINESLKNRYDTLQQSEQVAEKELSEEKSKITEQNQLNEVSVKPVDQNLDASQSLTSMQLYNLLEDNISLLIVDVRPKSDFSESHIKRSSCINIPSEILTPGITAAVVERLLPPESLEGWSKRNLVDFVILLDWNSSFDSMPNGSAINCLMEAICKWDQSTVLKTNPIVLKGGYEDWILHFPSYTTNTNITLPSRLQENQIELSLNVAYPDLDEEVLNSLTENESKIDANIINSLLPSVQPKPVIDRKTKPSMSAPAISRSNSSILDEIQTPSVKIVNGLDHFADANTKQSDDLSNQIPVVNRSTKPLNNKETSLAEKSLEVSRERLAQERQFETLCLQREQEAEMGMREQLQQQEEELRAKIESLEQAKLASEQKLSEVRQENESMKEKIENFQKIKEVKEEEQVHQQKMRVMDEKKKELDLEVERLRQLRKQNENKVQDSKIPVQKLEPIGSTYTVSLKEAPLKRSLSRSHSSPDISRLLEEEEKGETIPQVDRKLKPNIFEPSKQPKPIFDLSTNRLRNFSPIYSSQGRSETGLRNLGNTCFMNSVIQCLYSTIPLTGYLLQEYKQHVNKENELGTGGEIAEELSAVIQLLYRGLYRSIAPSDFKLTVSRYLPVCVGYEQQDAHEFLVVLFEKLHADLNRARIIRPPKAPTNDKEFWQWHTLQNSSIVTELFEGLLKSTLRCLSCNVESSSYEVFSSLSLPISTSNKCSLKGCIQKFLETERMCGEASWDCPNCKQKREAEKYLAICRLPVVLIIHLKRFSYEGMWRRKLQTYVDFPVKELEMAPHLTVHKNDKTKYSLYGIVNHYGTLEGGHYIAYCKNQASEKWFKYDDHDVVEISSSQVQTSAAYLLFYTSVQFS